MPPHGHLARAAGIGNLRVNYDDVICRRSVGRRISISPTYDGIPAGLAKALPPRMRLIRQRQCGKRPFCRKCLRMFAEKWKGDLRLSWLVTRFPRRLLVLFYSAKKVLIAHRIELATVSLRRYPSYTKYRANPMGAGVLRIPTNPKPP